MKLKVVVASDAPGIIELLNSQKIKVEIAEARTTFGLYSALTGSSLVIVDEENLIPSMEYPIDFIRNALDTSGIPHCRGEEFLQNPQEWLQKALIFSGFIHALPPITIALTSLSGGVGKTTLALHTALYASSKLRIPVLLTELVLGESAFNSLLNNNFPDVYAVFKEKKEMAKWNGISILPMNFEPFTLIIGDPSLPSLYTELFSHHSLSIIDAPAFHPFFFSLAEKIDFFVVLADPRRDSISNASFLLRKLQKFGGKKALVINKVGVKEKMALLGLERDKDIPFKDNAERFDGSLGNHIIDVIYPGRKR